MHLLVWFPNGPKGPFMQYVSVVKPPEGLNTITEPFLPNRGESWLREVSKRVSETA